MRRIIWLYGRPGSGKTTLSVALRATLTRRGHTVCLLDSDHMRLGPNIDLGYDDEARTENVKRLSLIALLLSRADDNPFVIVSAVTPRVLHRLLAERLCDPLLAYVTGAEKKLWLGTRFEEVLADEDKACCQDCRRAEKGDVHLDTQILSPDHCATLIVQKLQEEGLL